MIGRRGVIGLSLLCALVFCALAAQSATAAFAPAKNTTAFTCVKGGESLEFKDAHCDERVVAGTGSYSHLVIELNKTTEIEITNKETKSETKESTPAVFKSTYESLKFEVVCQSATSATAAEKSFIHNVETAPGEHKVTGTAAVVFSECTVNNKKCTVANFEMNSLFEGVEGGGAGSNEMGVEFKPDPSSSKTLVAIFFEGGECPLGNVREFEGTAIATGTPNPKEKWSGATVVFTNPMTEETLKHLGKSASFSATLTMRMAGNESPISLTTAT